MSLRVQHFLATTSARYSLADDGMPQYDLQGFRFAFRLAGINESSWRLPTRIDSFDFMTRFFDGQGAIDFEIEWAWIDQPRDQSIPLVATYGPFTVAFRSDDTIRDFLFRLVRLPIFGSGRYSATLFQITGKMQGQRTRLATEYLVAMA
jgi:hypothetical protein